VWHLVGILQITVAGILVRPAHVLAPAHFVGVNLMLLHRWWLLLHVGLLDRANIEEWWVWWTWS